MIRFPLVPIVLGLTFFLPSGGERRKLSGDPMVVAVGSVRSFEVDEDGDWIVYLADQDRAGIPELYAVPQNGFRAAERRSGTLVASGEIRAYRITPDGQRLLYLADQDVNDVFELFSVPLAGGTPVRLNAPLVAGGDVQEGSTFQNSPFSFVATPDGRQVVYRADQDVNDREQLFAVPADGSAAPLALFPPATWPVTVSHARLSPDGAQVVFVADLLADNVLEVFRVPLDASASPVRLSAALVAGGDVQGLELTPDGTRVLHLADQEVDGRNELWSVPLDGSSAPIRLNGALAGTNDVLEFTPDPTSQRVVYRARLATDTRFELHAAPVDGSAPSAPLSTPGTTDVFSFRIASDGSRVAYFRSGEILSAPLDASTPPVVLGTSAASDFGLSPDGSLLVYREPGPTSGLHAVPLDGSAAPVELTRGATLYPARSGPIFSAHSSRVFFLCGPGSGSARAVYSVPMDGSSTPALLNAPNPWATCGLPALGARGRVFFLSDEVTNGTFEIVGSAQERGGSPMVLSGPLAPTLTRSTVGIARVSPDGKWAVYSTQSGLFAASMRESTPPVRLSPGAGPNFSPVLVSDILISDDSATVFFGWRENGYQALCRTAIDGRSPPLVLQEAFASLSPYGNPGFRDLRLTPDQATLVCHHDLGANSSPAPTRILACPADGSAAPVLLAQDDGGFLELSPDGRHAIFDNAHYVFPSEVGQAVDQSLWSVPVDGSAPAARFFETDPAFQVRVVPFVEGGAEVLFRVNLPGGASELRRAPVDGSSPGVVIDAGVTPAFRVSPDGAHVAYCVRTGSGVELRDRALDLGSPPVVLESLGPASDIADLEFTRDGAKLVFQANPTPARYELFRAVVDRSRPVRRINFPFVSGGSVGTHGFGAPADFRISPDGMRVVYLCNGRLATAFELFSSPLEGPVGGGPGTLLHEPLSAGKRIQSDFQWLLGGQAVLHRGDSPGGNHDVLTLARLDGAGDFLVCSGPVANPAAVIAGFVLAPRQDAVVYRASEEVANAFELYAFPLPRHERPHDGGGATDLAPRVEFPAGLRAGRASGD